MAMALTANAQNMELKLGTLEIEEGVGMLEVTLNADFDFVGWQMYVYTPDGIVPLDVDLNDRYPANKLKKKYHAISIIEAEGGDYPGSFLILCKAEDANNNAIVGQEGVIGTILFDCEGYKGTAADAEITIKGFAVAKASGEQINLDGDVTTGIEFITRSMNPNGNGAIYNLSGQRVEKASKGLYIKNGQKVVVK